MYIFICVYVKYIIPPSRIVVQVACLNYSGIYASQPGLLFRCPTQPP